MSVPNPEDLKGGHASSEDELKLTQPAMLNARDNHIREQWIKAMEVRIVREELIKCQRGEGVDAHVHCRELSERYLSMLADAKVRSIHIPRRTLAEHAQVKGWRNVYTKDLQ